MLSSASPGEGHHDVAAGKVAIVTGADSGIGQAIAELFARQGADVAIGDHTAQDGITETQRKVEAAGRRVCVIQADVGDPRCSGKPRAAWHPRPAGGQCRRRHTSHHWP